MKTVATGRFLALVDDDGWEYAHRVHGCHVAIIIPVTSDGHIVFVSQYRKPIQNTALEFPAGLVGDVRGDETVLEAAQAELLEEAGLKSENWKVLTQGPASAGLTDETVTMYLALDCEQVAEGGGEEGEDIEIHRIPKERAQVFVHHSEDEGVAIDPKLYCGLYFLKENNII